jgi:isoleucyl-tRNA synthetase
MEGENLNFNDKELEDIVKGPFRMLWNSYSFFLMYTSIDKWSPSRKASDDRGEPSENILDRWILSELQLLIQNVGKAMDRYELSKAARAFMPFIDTLSNWYIRRSRKRFWKSEDDGDKENAYQTLYDVLVTLSKVMAPFTPFLSEEIFKNLTGEESVHLADWPKADEKLIDEKLNEEMQVVRNLVTEGLKLRTDAKIKVRQPLGVSGIRYQVSGEMQEILKEELNVKNIVVDEKQVENITLNTEITEELKLEGEMREVVRAIQEGRKKAKFNVEDRIMLGYRGKENVFAKFEREIAKEVLATAVQKGDLSDAEYNETVEFDGEKFSFALKRVK